MKRFIINILLFCLPIVAWLFFKWSQDNNPQFAANFTKGDCSEIGVFVHDRIVQNKAKIDIAFFGTSHTIDAIDDEYLSKQLNKNVVNLGYCHLGRNLQALFVELLFTSRNEQLPEKIILEVRENEETSSHPMYAYWADSEQMFQTPFNRDYFSDWYTYTISRIEYDKSIMLQRKYKDVDKQFGHRKANKDTINTVALDGFKERHTKRLESVKNNFQNTHFNDQIYRLPKYYLNKIHQLCEANNVELQFIYLPSFSSVDIEPQHLEFYQNLGKIIVPPKEIWDNQDYWFDKSHVNVTGSKALSQWLATQL